MDQLIEPKVNSNVFEADVDRIAGEFEQKRSLPENKDSSSREVVRKTIHEMTGHPLPVSGQKLSKDKGLLGFLTDMPEAAQREVAHYLDLVEKEGILNAVKKAQESNPQILDAFHDALTEKMHEKLEGRGF